MKTLEQIEPRTPIAALPFTISSPGSYYVTGNLAGVANQDGIIINADNVTLDLGGFEIVGTGPDTTTRGRPRPRRTRQRDDPQWHGARMARPRRGRGISYFHRSACGKSARDWQWRHRDSAR
jgi:hypothetical protein